MHHQVDLAQVVRCRNLFQRLGGLLRRIVDYQMKFNGFGVDVYRPKVSQAVGQQHCGAAASESKFLVTRNTKRFQVVETVGKKNILVVSRRVDNEVEPGIGTESKSISQARQL